MFGEEHDMNLGHKGQGVGVYWGDPSTLAAQDSRHEVRRAQVTGWANGEKHKPRPDLVKLTGVCLSEAKLSHVSYAVCQPASHVFRVCALSPRSPLKDEEVEAERSCPHNLVLT